jgi:hypothetical protein
MAARTRKRATGPRVATRWIGDAFVLDGDLSRGAPAVWRGPDAHGARNARCARVRIVEVTRDFEFGVDELLRNYAASTVRGECVVPRLATYRDEDVLALVDDDVADVTLAQLLARLDAGPSRVALALFIGRACARAWQAASLVERVIVEMQPSQIALAWDGGVHLRVSPLPSDDAWEWAEDPLDAVSYEVAPGREERTLGALLYAIIAGTHPFVLPAAEDDGDADDDYVRARALADRRDRNVHVPLRDVVDLDVPHSVHALVEGLLAPPPERRRSWDQLLAAIDAELAREPFDAAALAGMLDAMFPDEKRAALLEREDRLGVMPASNVMQAEWALLDDDAALEDDDGGNLSGLWHEPELEPRVEPIDPFDDER